MVSTIVILGIIVVIIIATSSWYLLYQSSSTSTSATSLPNTSIVSSSSTSTSTTIYYNTSSSIANSTTTSTSTTSSSTSSTSTITSTTSSTTIPQGPSTVYIGAGCYTANQSNTNYILTTDMDCYNGTGIIIESPAYNSTINCKGHTIQAVTGVAVESANDVTIKNCVLYPSTDGIEIESGNNDAVINDTVTPTTNSSWAGIELSDSNHDKIINSTSDYSWFGIFLTNSSYDLVEGNKVYFSRTAGFQMTAYEMGPSSNNRILDNNFSNNYDSGIETDINYMYGAHEGNNTIEYNIVNANYDCGMEIVNESDDLIEYNIANGNNNFGIDFDNFAGTKIVNTRVINNVVLSDFGGPISAWGSTWEINDTEYGNANGSIILGENPQPLAIWGTIIPRSAGHIPVTQNFTVNGQQYNIGLLNTSYDNGLPIAYLLLDNSTTLRISLGNTTSYDGFQIKPILIDVNFRPYMDPYSFNAVMLNVSLIS